MSGLTHWKSALAAHVRAARSRPFQYGTHDCCLWAANWIWLKTGHDPARRFRGKYHDEAGAHDLIERAGGLVTLVTTELGASYHPRFAALGDVIVRRDWSKQTHLGIVWQACAVFPGATGLERRAPRDCLRAWRV